MSSTLWGIYSPDQEDRYNLQLGPLMLYIKWIANDIWIAHRIVSWPVPLESETPKPSLKWERWALPEDDTAIELYPLMPSYPVLLKPEDPYRVLPDSSTRIYTRIPVYIGIRTAKHHYGLTQIPAVLLSNTWFGSPVEGELCLSHFSSVRRFLTDDFFLPHLISCTLEIRNESPKPLHFEKICLRTDQMSIFAQQAQLWSDVVKVTYRGEEAQAMIEMPGMAPAEISEATLVAKARSPKGTNIAVRTFDLIRDISFF
jgi:hypothetical protein